MTSKNNSKYWALKPLKELEEYLLERGLPPTEVQVAIENFKESLGEQEMAQGNDASTLDMDNLRINSSKEYIELATRTENKDYSGIGDRLIRNQREVFKILNEMIELSNDLDASVKKRIFYGKEPKDYKPLKFPDIIRPGDSSSESFLRSLSFIRLLHGFMGIATEAGEGLEALARGLRDDGRLDFVNIGEENGDIDWYQAVIADECGTTFEAEQAKNIRKLHARTGDKFAASRVMDRDTEQEYKILSKEKAQEEKKT